MILRSAVAGMLAGDGTSSDVMVTVSTRCTTPFVARMSDSNISILVLFQLSHTLLSEKGIDFNEGLVIKNYIHFKLI